MNGSRSIREFGKATLHRVFEAGQRLGADILPRHFYSSIPDIRHLRMHSYWKRPLSMTGIAGCDLGTQRAFLETCCPESLRSRIQKGDIYSDACAENGDRGFGLAEAEVLFCFITTKRPRRVVQIGAGVSTAVMLRAAQEADHAIDITCIDPYPTPYLARAARAGKLRLISEMAETVGMDIFAALGEGDLLFIDSTHSVRVGGEVNRLILEVLPALQPGAYVHFHDIYFPYDYSRNVLDSLFFSLESTLLYAFLVHNARYEIAVSLSMLHYACPGALTKILPDYRPQPNDEGLCVPGTDGHFPSSTYLFVVR